MSCDEHDLNHIEDAEYHGHEIIIMQCPKCKVYIVDARSDNFDGEMLAGYIDKSIYNAIEQAKASIDKHCVELALTVDIPF